MKRAIAIAALCAAACGVPDDTRPRPCKELFPASQTLSEPCCEEWGVDACGAGLFCAAFDGRKQATCYAENSRRDGEACGADLHCASRSCNVEKAACRSSNYARCDVTIGCAPSLAGDTFWCDDVYNNPPQCSGLLSCNSSCTKNEQCLSQACGTVRGACLCLKGENCYGATNWCKSPLVCDLQNHVCK
jgi:hypothetical protein